MEKTQMNLKLPFASKRLIGSNTVCEGPCVNENNKRYIQEFYEEIHSNQEYFTSLEDPLGSGRDVILSDRDRYGLPINTVMNLDTGLIRSDPYYTDDAIQILYRSYYRKIYGSSFGRQFAPKATLTTRQIEKGLFIFSKVATQLKKNSRILDYGCGVGGTILPFKEAGHTVLGLDYGEDYLKYGHELGIPLLQGGLESLEGQDKFDLIILSHVLEHLKNPMQFLKAIRQWLTEDGLVYIEVPGLQWVHRTWNNDLLLHLQNAHIWYFTSHTLRAMLSRVDFEVQEQFGSVAVLAKPQKLAPISTSKKHAADCLRYLNLNEWVFRSLFGVSNLPKPIKNKMFSIFRGL